MSYNAKSGTYTWTYHQTETSLAGRIHPSVYLHTIK